MLGAFLLTAAAAVSTFQSVQVNSTHDGDTFNVSLPNQAEVFGSRISVRIRGIDTAEIKDKRACARADAKLAKESLTNLLKNSRVDLNRCKRDKFFRVLCDVMVNGKTDVTAYQLARGHAVPYDGKKKPVWVCSKKDAT